MYVSVLCFVLWTVDVSAQISQTDRVTWLGSGQLGVASANCLLVFRSCRLTK